MPEGRAPAEMPPTTEPVLLREMDYVKARAVPGASYSSEHHCMVLQYPTARAAIVALALQPSLANNHPELVELRDTLIKDVRPVDHATRVRIPINAPVVHQTLLDAGHDWLQFDREANQPVDGRWPNQQWDLGYAAAMLNKTHFFLLGWTRGGGKTLGAAAIIEANDYTSVLVAAPNTSKLDTWLRELELRLPSHQILVLGNTPTTRASALAAAQDLSSREIPFVLVVHHESLALIAGAKERPSGKGKTVLNGWKDLNIVWDLFVFDESHRLKNAGANGSQLHRAACKVPAHNALALTGSLYENSWEELYGTLHWMAPKRYKSQWADWNLRFFDYVEGYGKVWVGILPGKEEDMRQELGVFTIVREKADRTTHQTLKVKLSKGQRRAYDELVEVMLTRLEDDTWVSSEAGVVQLTRLRQIASGLDLLSEKVTDSSKTDAAVKIMKKNLDHDFFVAVWYKASAHALARRLEKEGYNVFVVTGDTPMGERTRLIQASRRLANDKAMRGSTPVVVIGTIATMGESVNLQHLNHVIRIDRSFNPALNRQVVDRVDRTGQEREVFCDDIVAADTVDELVVLPSLATKNAFRAIILGRGA